MSDVNVARSGAPEITTEKEHAHHVELGDDDLKRDHMNYDRVDSEVAKYATDEIIEISTSENLRLKRLVDIRVLAVMIVTYFLQALDKGTLSFASIMGIKTDTHLVGQQVCTRQDNLKAAD